MITMITLITRITRIRKTSNLAPVLAISITIMSGTMPTSVSTTISTKYKPSNTKYTIHKYQITTRRFPTRWEHVMMMGMCQKHYHQGHRHHHPCMLCDGIIIIHFTFLCKKFQSILRVGMCAVEPIYVSAHVNCTNLINAVEYYKNALIASGNQS